MSAQLLLGELSNIASEAKRKNIELRNAAEKSTQELKALPATSEQQLAADLSRRPAFIEPFLLACTTRNAKLASSGVMCLQRLVISSGLPKARLQDALEAFNACTDLGLDVQLKILQALPSLLQNYADELKGDLLASALQVCAALQSSKVSTVNGVASATLQQLATTVFGNVVREDRHAKEVPTVAEVPGVDGSIALRPAAYDAYRIFRDLVMMVEGRKTKFVQLAALSAESSLELIWSCIDANAVLFKSHTELSSIVASNLLPIVTQALSERLEFPITLRCLRILNLVMTRYFAKYAGECEVALGLITHSLDPDTAPLWKRAMMLEITRNFFTTGTLVIDAYAAYDSTEGGKSVVQDLMSAFVRLSTEKPSVIGLGQQSTAPTGPSSASRNEPNAGLAVDVDGVWTGGIVSTLGVLEVNIPGISAQWSIPRSACLDQLDKSEPPAIPETYIYSLALECLNSLSDSLAKAVLPLSVQHDQPRKRDSDDDSEANGRASGERPSARMARSQSFRKRAVPLNPLELGDNPSIPRVRAVAALIDSCWPAILATSSTFLNAALDDQYYRALIKAYQRFVQVAGLLRLTTPRDALLTTLGKAAVPSHVLNSAMIDGMKSPSIESPRTFSNPRSLLSVDSLVSQASTMSSLDKDRRSSIEPGKPSLTIRNLLCLRALLNLAIALGPTLENAFGVIVDVLKQADIVLSTAGPHQVTRQKGTDSPAVVQAFTAEVNAVESAASRLLESTADYPNDAFTNVLHSFTRLLKSTTVEAVTPTTDHASPPPTPTLRQSSFSGLPGVKAQAEMQTRDYRFVIPKLGHLAELNILRFVSSDPDESGWDMVVNELNAVATASTWPKEARRAACDVLCKLASECIAQVAEEDEGTRTTIQRRGIAVLLQLVNGIYAEYGELSNTDLEVQGHVLDALRGILEHSGESLVAGWTKSLAILSSVFESEKGTSTQRDDGRTSIEWARISSELISSQLGRVAFSAIQLVCSDFLSSVPLTVLPSLIELLYRFISQVDDLNIALTGVTLAWNLSDALFDSPSRDDLKDLVASDAGPGGLEDKVQTLSQRSKSGQWLLLLLRLRLVVQESQKEVRSAAFQTICSITKNHGGDLSPAIWDLLLRSITLQILEDDTQRNSLDDSLDKTGGKPLVLTDIDVSASLLTGTSEVLSQHVHLLEHIDALPRLWETIMRILNGYLDARAYIIDAAVFSFISRILANLRGPSAAWQSPVAEVSAFCALRKHARPNGNSASESNEGAFLAYVVLISELYRLRHDSLDANDISAMLKNLDECVRGADAPSYGADVNALSPLQSKVMALLKQMRSDLPCAPSLLIDAAARLITLHQDKAESKSGTKGPSFVAVAAEAIEWLQSLVANHVANIDIFSSDALSTALGALGCLMDAKYAFRTECKGVTLWRHATVASLAIASPILERAEQADVDRAVWTSLWTEYVRISNAIVKANNLHLYDDVDRIYEDQLADMESFKSLRKVLIPRMGNPKLPDDTRVQYTRALLDASIIHPTERGEVPEPDQSPLEGITQIRRGRVRSWPYFPREKMSYACFDELIALSTKSDGSPQSKKLAQAAAPLLILRLAIPIRAYVADQPLRGRRPQPLSELEELVFCFEQIKKLELEAEALAIDPLASGQRGGKPWVQYLCPLLVKAMGTAGDKWSGSDQVLKQVQSVLQALAAATYSGVHE